MSSFQKVFAWQGTINRKQYLLWGIILFAVKYNLDRLVAISFGRQWFFTDYFIKPDYYAITGVEDDDMKFFGILLVLSLPFIWLGTVFCVKRLRDVGLPTWLVIFFFIPMLNFLLFLVLAALPTGNIAMENPDKQPSFLNAFIPNNKIGSALVSVGLVAFASLLFTIFSVQLLGQYGWGLFVGVPFFTGFASVLLYSYHQPRTYKDSMIVTILSVVFFGAAILLIALEGFLCVMMGAPLCLILAWLGGTIAYFIQERSRNVSVSAISPMFIILIFVVFAEKYAAHQSPLIAIKTSVLVKAKPQAVWDKLVAFSEIAPPKELLFHTGIAYPTHAAIEGIGEGAIRECHFTTGAFIEPITEWKEPELLRFSVLQQPPPLVEWSFYNEMNLPHLEGYFGSEKGQFLLTKTEEGTILEGTTWYRHKIWPANYWKLWSDYILHQIHFRVLNHIKKEAEADI
ncbi:DUF805 domain-containing protein [Chondrinema litorale]|uniref:DUF805 domain-containing protein n=1 Tax=Chondrinema litorale TaxID=2994555 RepID=UPI0025437975|nr:DUF805 domain-containing protein [Chondrinema litorale]UZR93346.1 DUF805 domain-containing protein [Chondrinema litorale]